MPSLKDLAFMVSGKKEKKRSQHHFFFLNKKCQLSPLNTHDSRKKKKEEYIHDLLHIISNCTKFQLNPIRTQNFQLKLFDSAVTMKYNQGH